MKNSLWFEGLTDALGFMGGSLLGFGLGGLGGGMALQGVRHWRQTRNTGDQEQ